MEVLEIVPTLQRGNAASDAPASRQAEPSNIVVSRSHGHRGKMGWLRLTGGGSHTGRWSVRGCIPTLERGNDKIYANRLNHDSQDSRIHLILIPTIQKSANPGSDNRNAACNEP